MCQIWYVRLVPKGQCEYIELKNSSQIINHRSTIVTQKELRIFGKKIAILWIFPQILNDELNKHVKYTCTLLLFKLIWLYKKLKMMRKQYTRFHFFWKWFAKSWVNKSKNQSSEVLDIFLSIWSRYVHSM